MKDFFFFTEKKKKRDKKNQKQKTGKNFPFMFFLHKWTFDVNKARIPLSHYDFKSSCQKLFTG